MAIKQSLEEAMKMALPDKDGNEIVADSWDWSHFSMGHWWCFRTNCDVYERYVDEGVPNA